MPILLDEPFYIDSFLVQPERNRVYLNDDALQMEPKLMDLLTYFAKHPGEVLSRQKILDAVWEETYVEEISLTRAVSEIRKIFNDDPRQPEIIETIHKRGYRLIADVRPAVDVSVTNRKEIASESTGDSGSSFIISQRAWLLGIVVGIIVITGVLLFSQFTGQREDPDVSLIPGTVFQGIEIDTSLSPDGSQLVYVWRPPDKTQGDIYLKSIGAGTATHLQLTDSPDEERHPSWSPRGNQIAFVRFDGSSSAIFVIPSMGGIERKIIQVEGSRYPNLAWSPDGRWLAFSDRLGSRNAKTVQLVNLDTKELDQITLPPSHHYGDFHPVFSPDGSRIAFVRGQAKGIHDIFIMNLESLQVQRITTDYKRIGGLTFSSDGLEIIFSSDRGGTFSLWSVPAEGGAPRWLSYAGEGILDPVVSRLEGLLAYEKWESNMDIWQLSLTRPDREMRQIPALSTSRGEMAPSISPDGQQLVFMTSRSGSPQLWISDIDGDNAHMLIDLKTPMLGPARWSPDSRLIVFNSRESGNADIYTYNLETGRKKRFTTDQANDITPSFSHDGKSIYFGSDREGTWQLYRKPIGRNSPVRIAGEGGFFAIESGDGKNLYVSHAQKEGIWEIQPDGSMKKIIDDLEPHQWYNWDVVQSGIYYVGKDQDSEPALKKYNAGSIDIIRTLPGWPETPGFSITPDGENLLLVFESEGESDIMTVQFD